MRPHPLPVGRGEAAADGVLGVTDTPPEAVPVPHHFLPESFAGRLAGERPGAHHVDLDQRREPDLESKKRQRFKTRWSRDAEVSG